MAKSRLESLIERLGGEDVLESVILSTDAAKAHRVRAERRAEHDGAAAELCARRANGEKELRRLWDLAAAKKRAYEAKVEETNKAAVEANLAEFENLNAGMQQERAIAQLE